MKKNQASISRGGKWNRKNRAGRYEQILLLGCDVNQAVIGQPEETEEDRCRRSDTIIVLSLDNMTGNIMLKGRIF